MKHGNTHELCEPGVFRIAGKEVNIQYRGKTHKFRLSKGMRHLAALLYYRELPLKPEQLELDEHNAILEKSSGVSSAERLELGYSLSMDFPAYEMADLATVKELKRRLIQIISELAEAESWNDYSRKDDLETERDKLIAYLRQVYRPGGKLRNFPTDRVLQRKRILKSLNRALEEIKAAEPELAIHLVSSLSLTEYFVYRPSGFGLEVLGY